MAAPEGGPAGPPPWDVASMVAVRCDVVNAVAAAPGHVELHFGHRVDREDGAVGVDRLRTVELTPFAAKRLQELLVELLRHHDSRG